MKHRIAQIVLAQILCIGGVLYLYYPLNNFIPDWDQWVYFLDTLNYNNAIDLITKFYSYNRVRKFFPGDTLVFRPLLFSLLGIEKAWFGADFFKWQLLSAAIHAVNTALFIHLLWLFKKSSLAYLFGGVFAVSIMMSPAIKKINISGYLLFVTFMFLTLIYLRRYILFTRTTDLRRSLLTLGFACFTYELGGLLSIIFASYVWYLKRKKQAWLFLIPVMLYAMVSAGDYAYHFQRKNFEAAVNANEDVRILQGIFNIKTTVRNFYQFNLLHLRNFFALNDVTWNDFSNWRTLLVTKKEALLNIIFIGIAGICLFLSFTSNTKLKKRRMADMLLGLLILGAYVYLNVIGRMNPRPQIKLMTHYGYTFSAIFLFFLYIPMSVTEKKRYTWYSLKGILILLLGIIIVYNGSHVLRERAQRPKGFLQMLQEFIDQHSHSPDFSFMVEERIMHYDGISLPMVLFHKYHQECPQFIIRYTNNQFIATENNQEMCFPLLIDFTGMSPRFNPYQGYMIYKYGETFIATEYGKPSHKIYFPNKNLSEVKESLLNKLLAP